MTGMMPARLIRNQGLVAVKTPARQLGPEEGDRLYALPKASFRYAWP